MTTFTTNYRLTLYDYNLPGWNTAVNNNFIAIDATLAQFNAGINLQGLWTNSTAYAPGMSVVDGVTGHIWANGFAHTSIASPGTFLADRVANPTYWTDITNPAATAAQSAVNAAASQVAAAASQSAAAASASAASTSASTASAAATATASNIGRNFFHNSMFRVVQRGAGAFTANGAYSADRWMQLLSTSTLSTTVATLVDADRTAIGDEAATVALQCVVGGTAGAGDFALITQRLESVFPLAGKTVTVSFWAKTNAGTPKVGVGANQIFGTGGSPSASVIGTASPVTLSTTWTRYSITLNIPSVIGKTLGSTAGTDYTEFRFWMSSGTTNNTIAGGVGVQSATFTFWGMQLEIASSVSALEKPQITYELQQCQRFYQFGTFTQDAYNSAAATSITTMALVPMRVAPVCTISPVTNTNCASFTLAATSVATMVFSTTITALGAYLAVFTWTASADL